MTTVVPSQLNLPTEETLAVDTPIRRRGSRSRTKSPEPLVVKVQEPVLSAVVEEPEEISQESARNQQTPMQTQSHPDPQMYEKIIDEMDVDESQEDVNEDELLAEPEDSAIPAVSEEKSEDASLEAEKPADGKPSTDDENRGTKRRSDSPAKGNTPKKRQRLPPPNIEDFVNDEDEPELDETTLQLSWCK